MNSDSKNLHMAREEGRQTAEMRMYWFIELAKRNFGGAQESIFNSNELAAAYSRDSHKIPFASAFYKGALDVMNNIDITEVVQKAGLDEQGKVFVFACYYHEILFLTRAKVVKKQYSEMDEQEVCARVAQVFYGETSQANSDKVKVLLEKMDVEIENGFTTQR